MSHPSSWQAGDTDLQNRYRRFSKLAATKSRSRGDRRIVRATSVTTVSNIWNGALRRKATCSKGALRTPLPESTANTAKAITLAHSATGNFNKYKHQQPHEHSEKNQNNHHKK